MNSRKRKKYMKKHGTWVNDRQLWNFDMSLAKYIVPRLKRFKEVNIAYPGREDMDTPEKWDDALDKMILAFELCSRDGLDLFDGEIGSEEWKAFCADYDAKVSEGLQLFAKWYQSLWI